MVNTSGLTVFAFLLLLTCNTASWKAKDYKFEDIPLEDFKRETVENEDERPSYLDKMDMEWSQSEHGLERGKYGIVTSKTKRDDKEPRIPYIPNEIISKLREVRDVNDFNRVFNVKGRMVRSPQMDQSTLCADDTGCKPRSDIYTIPAPISAQYIFFPSCVQRSRCIGCCISGPKYKCVGDETEVEKRSVMIINFDGTTSNETVNIVHDKTCKCACRYNQSDCLPTQTFNPNYCQCECNKTPETCPDGMQWSYGHCGCICSSRPPCTMYEKFDTNTCKCICNTDKCPDGWPPSRNTCQCRG